MSKIGVIAPAAACEPERFKAGLNALESYGFTTEVVGDPCAQYGKNDFLFSSDSAAIRAQGLETLFSDPKIDAIWCARGSYGSMEILTLLDYELIRANPKPLIGFSDITALLIALNKLSGTPTIHGVNVSGAFAETTGEAKESVEATVSYIKGLSTQESLFGDYKLAQLAPGIPGKGVGKLLGGSLTIVCSLLGTPYEIETDGAVLFLEEFAERPYRIHRMLQQLRLAGKLEKLSGVILGSFEKCEHQYGASLECVFDSFFSDATYPVLKDAPFGHSALNLPVPLGRKVEINASEVYFVS